MARRDEGPPPVLAVQLAGTMFDRATNPDAHGPPVYDPDHDEPRLHRQLAAVLAFMRDGAWHTVPEIAAVVPGTQTSLSAKLRTLRRPEAGGWIVERRRRAGQAGVHEFRLLPPAPQG